MTPTALALVLAAAVLHAIWNMAAKAKTGDSFVFVWWYVVFSTVLTLPVGLWVMAAQHQGFTPALLWAPAISAGLHLGYNLVLQTGYEKAPLSVVYPTARGTGPVLTMLVAVCFLGERPGWAAALGALVIVGGIVITATGPRTPVGLVQGSDAGPSPLVSGLVWGVGTGVFIAGYTLWDDRSVASLALAPIPYFAMSSLYQSVIASVQLTRARRAMLRRSLRENLWPILVIAVFSPAAYILVLIAMQTQPVSLVAPLRETSIVIGSLLAWLVFKEARPGRRLLGAAVVLAGVALISL